MTSFMTFTKMTDRSVAASSCLLLAPSAPSVLGTGLSAITALSPVALVARRVSERNERPFQAPVAVAAGQAKAHAYGGFAAAAGAGHQMKQTTTQHHLMWAFRGLEPWSDPV
ncbi:hypothetical protein OHS33_24165 [Streptomyces sp. NBC_00536]|uniref:hypothetical protein n=1 Tax=Streptomyces sp. NBC_00536 TaxID=2975769 RepID=UPI002E81DC60|nr:hypothetical protein [Streptomyces sp. NBC_00536]WUC81157.1 hypothetical protein OHS33_24165 [Streptomyces sp. NBC_00536]